MSEWKLNEDVILCNHKQAIADDGDAYCIQCSDGYGDICKECVEKSDSSKIIYVCDENMSDRIIEGIEYDDDGYAIYPYAEHISDWVFLGTIKELKKYLKSC